MGEFYKLYPKEFYTLNDLVPEDFLENQPHILINTINCANRCINYNIIDPQKKRFQPDLFCNVISYIKEHESLFKRYVDAFMLDSLRKQYRAFLSGLIEKKPQKLTQAERIDIHYYLVDLYHSFPIDPDRYLDGILKKIETRLAGRDIRFKYATLDMLSKQQCPYNGGLPWAKIRLYGFDDDNGCIQIPLDATGTSAEEAFASQYDLKILNQCPQSRVAENIAEASDGQAQAEGTDALNPADLFFRYLYPLFADAEFDGRCELKKIGEIPFWSFIAIPIYSAFLPISGSFGPIMGHLFLSFSNQDKRQSYLENHTDAIRLFGEPIVSSIRRTLHEGRAHFVAENGFTFNDSLKSLLENSTCVQDWQRIMFFKNEHAKEPAYCFKRMASQQSGGPAYEQVWGICEQEYNCEQCNGEIYHEVMALVRSYNSKDGQVSPESSGRCLKKGKQCLYFQKFDEILDTRVLPSLEEKDISKYQNAILCFEFTECTFFPVEHLSKEKAIEKSGRYFFKQLFPLFDRVLMKKKVIKHSLKSAVAAIISRNHSHHIGSHVSPRSTVGIVTERLTALKVFSDDIDKIPKKSEADEQARELDRRLRQLQLRNAVIDRLKSDLDAYIQKKADFSAELATEPVISTKSALFFSEVILPFSANSLLVDNLGANEGVRYTSANDSRIQFRLLMEGEETEAWFGGQSRSCNCPPVPHRKRPYAGTCTCLESTLQLVAPYPPDRSIALPGPLGEFAVYSFLENLIRNSVKHNRSWFRQDPRHRLEVSINLSEIRDESPLCATHLLCEVWDNVTDPSTERQLIKYAQRSLIDDQGRLLPDGWGLAEMRIMASLLRGERSFTRPPTDLELISVRPKNGADTLVYQFYLMKCRQIALVQEGIVVPDTMQYHGIHGFDTLEELLGYQKYSHSPAAFEFVFFGGGQEAVTIGKNFAQLPSRLLMVDQAGGTVPGGCRVGPADAVQILAAVESADPEWLIQLCWQLWLEHLRRRHEYQSPRLMLFFQQSRNESPTREWIETAAQPVGKSENLFSMSVIYGDGNSNRVEPSLDENASPEDLFFFDRHFAGWVPLASHRERFCYHHALDKGSPDFVPIMAAAPSWNMAQRLCEAAMLRVLVLDERVAEVAYNQLFQGEPKATRLYGGRERLRVGKWANIFIATHVCAQGAGPVPLHPSIDPKQFPRICLKLDTRGTYKEVPIFEVRWCPDQADDCDQCTIPPFSGHFDVLILHYGLLEVDGLLWTSLEGLPGETLTQKAHRFVEGLKPHVPQVVIDSGRGIPVYLPTGARFLPFSVIEAHLLKERLSKFNLTSALMGLTQNRG